MTKEYQEAIFINSKKDLIKFLEKEDKEDNVIYEQIEKQKKRITSKDIEKAVKLSNRVNLKEKLKQISKKHL